MKDNINRDLDAEMIWSGRAAYTALATLEAGTIRRQDSGLKL